jgi:hypothetical protein
MSSTKSWQVHALPRRNGSYRLRPGWSRFCKESDLKLGDVCTFDIVEITLWLVDVTRCKEKMNQFCYVSKILKHLSLLLNQIPNINIYLKSAGKA